MCSRISKAFTLIEVMVAMTVIVIVAIGALNYQYYAVQHSQIANTQTTATHAAQLLMDDWMSTGGLTTYDPTALHLGFTSATVPTGFTMGTAIGTTLNNLIYLNTVNNVPMQIILGWSDFTPDPVTGAKLRQLTVMVRWPVGGTLCTSPVILTTYIRVDT
ncbi:MAG: prepilin-type N-terminal cleavage/methylation domain-containing protein [Sedimentisphaerales bacterium]